jgi:hypothetical protein
MQRDTVELLSTQLHLRETSSEKLRSYPSDVLTHFTVNTLCESQASPTIFALLFKVGASDCSTWRWESVRLHKRAIISPKVSFINRIFSHTTVNYSLFLSHILSDFDSMAQPQAGAIRVSLACVQCRSRHLRCDAVTPICSRCVREGSECTYLKSRRGGRARAKRDGATTIPELPSLQNDNSKDIPRNLPARESLPSLTPDHSGSSSTSASTLSADDYLGWFPESDSGSLTRAPLLELYYTYFHPAQPCALPLRFLRQKASEDLLGIRLLVNVLQFIGSLYAPKVNSGPLEDLVKASLAEPRLVPNGFEIQALVLYSIAVYWCDEIERARELLDEATRKALAIGMNLRAFATEHSQGDAVLAESWRRTWWQLYSTDAHIASSNHAAHFGTSQRLVPCTVELPCEEDEYCSGVCLIIGCRCM